MSNLREDFIRASRLQFKAGIEKHRINVENKIYTIILNSFLYNCTLVVKYTITTHLE